MNAWLDDFLTFDLMPLLAAVLAAAVCALIGNFLVLRREAMLGDAISHAVLPGLAVAFILCGGAATFPMLAGAAAAGVLCAVLVDLVRRVAGLESGASMGVVFTVMFAIGVVLIARTARHTDLDADCVLYGDLESIMLSTWTPPDALAGWFTLDAWRDAPRQVVSLALAAALTAAGVALLFKELRLAAFDPRSASALGFPAGLLDLLTMSLVALAVVASFEAGGVVLVVAMLACPAAIARLLTDRLRTQLVLAVLIGAALAIAGYWIAAHGVRLATGGRIADVGAAGAIAALSGVGVGAAALLAPRHGVLARWIRRYRLRLRVLGEDLIAIMYRVDEARQLGEDVLRHPDTSERLMRALMWSPADRIIARHAASLAVRRGELSRDGPRLALTPAGRARASGVVRSHRLWEAYLVRVLGLRPDHVHDTAMRLEHITSPTLAAQLEGPTGDPHGRPIPAPAAADEGPAP